MGSLSNPSSPDRQEHHVDLLLAKAISHRNFNRLDEAAECLEQLLVIEPAHPSALNERGLILMAQGRLDAAEECFLGVLESDAQDPYAINRLSMLHSEKGELEEARSLLRRGLEINRYNPHILTQLALIEHQMGSNGKAAECLGKVRRYRNLGNQISHQAEILAKHMAPGVVIAGLAHEIRNILDSSNMALELLRLDLAGVGRRDEDHDKFEGRIARIEANSKRIYRLIQHFREIVKRERPESELLTASELVGFAFELLGEKLTNTGVKWEIVLEDAERIPLVYGNRVELEQVFINLVSNAFDALVESRTASPAILVEVVRVEPGSGVLVKVHDNGPGIPDDVVPRMFEMAFTTKESGTGVGLWLCAFAVERADGHIELERTGPQGTTFKVQFPGRGGGG